MLLADTLQSLQTPATNCREVLAVAVLEEQAQPLAETLRIFQEDKNKDKS